MRNKILLNIKNGLKTEIGEGSTTYTDLKIEDIQTRIPEGIFVNYFIGLSIEKSGISGYEIGRYNPSVNEYICEIGVLVKNGDYELGQSELDTIIRRITKYLAKDTGHLNGLEWTSDGVTERVISFQIESINYLSGKMKSVDSLGHIASIIIRVKTDLII